MSFLTGGGQKRGKPAEVTQIHEFPALSLENLDNTAVSGEKRPFSEWRRPPLLSQENQ